jgi:hypothetical protein
MTNIEIILNHIDKAGSISIRDAMADYGMSGGSLTKYISILNRQQERIVKVWNKHPITGKRFARYYKVDNKVA